MDHRVAIGERLGHVVRACKIADQGARAFDPPGTRPAQQHAQTVAALWQLAQQMLADEAGGASQRDEWPMWRCGARERSSLLVRAWPWLRRPDRARATDFTTGGSFGRIFERERQDSAVLLVGQGIERAVRALHHIANTGAHGNPLLCSDSLAVERKTNDRL